MPECGCRVRRPASGSGILLLSTVGLDQSHTPVTIVIAEHDEEGSELSWMVIADHLEDANQILIREIDLK